MRITFTTRVKTPYRRVFNGFDEELFRRLAPPFPPVTVSRFDGVRLDGEVHLVINLGIVKLHWESVITGFGEDEEEIFFIDEGRRLPLFMTAWRHRQGILNRGDESVISDEVEYRCRFSALEALLLPFWYFMLLYRKPVYRKVFGRP